MAQLLALLQSDPALLCCQLHRLDRAVGLGAPGKVVGVSYYENGKVLLRKRPVGPKPLTLEQLAGDVKSEFLLAASHTVSAGGFREEDTEPYRFRAWTFAGTGRIVPFGERSKVLGDLPEFLQRGLVGPSDAELAFLSTLGFVHAESRQLDFLDLDPSIAARALALSVRQLDERARQAGVPKVQTSAVLSNGRMMAAVRRGRPLSYALLEGLVSCEVCGVERDTPETDPRVRPHRRLKAVVLASRAEKQDGLQWIEVPEDHLFTVSRSLDVRLTPLT